MSAGREDCVIVYDVGGSHVSAAACFRNAYRLGQVVSARYPVEQSSDAFIDLLHSLGVQASVGAASILGASLAVPGPFDYGAGTSLMQHKLIYLYGIDLRRPLAERFGWHPEQIGFLGDAAGFLLGEIGAGAAHDAARAVGITLGTGIGSGFSVGGHIVTEGRGVAPGGEMWNIPFEGGIIEDFVSTRAIQGNYLKRAGFQREVAGIAAAAASDPQAAEVFADFGRDLGRILRFALSDFAPNVVVIGGGISRSAHLFLPAAEEQLLGLNFNLQISTLLDRAPLVGAGVAWFDGASQMLSLNGRK